MRYLFIVFAASSLSAFANIVIGENEVAPTVYKSVVIGDSAVYGSSNLTDCVVIGNYELPVKKQKHNTTSINKCIYIDQSSGYGYITSDRTRTSATNADIFVSKDLAAVSASNIVLNGDVYVTGKIKRGLNGGGDGSVSCSTNASWTATNQSWRTTYSPASITSVSTYAPIVTNSLSLVDFNDNTLVKKTANETIAGSWNFTGTPTVGGVTFSSGWMSGVTEIQGSNSQRIYETSRAGYSGGQLISSEDLACYLHYNATSGKLEVYTTPDTQSGAKTLIGTISLD